MFKGVELREHDNLVVRIDPACDAEVGLGKDGKLRLHDLPGRRLLRVVARIHGHEKSFPMTTPIKGPASSDPDGMIDLTTNMNPFGLAAVE
jgi:hypothetical protein